MTDDERWYRLLADNSTDAIVVVDPTGVIRYVSPSIRHLLGYEPAELIGRLSYDYVHPDDAPARGVAHDRIIDQPDMVTLETRLRRKDGEYRWVETTARRISDPSTGEVVEVQASCRDINDRKGAQEAQARLAAIVQSSHDAVTGATPDGIITSWNVGAERMFGYTAAEMVGSHGLVLLPPDRRGDTDDIMGRISSGERVVDLRTQRLRKDGTTIPVSITVAPILDASGALTGIGAVTRDLSSVERAEAMTRGLLDAAPDAMVCVDMHGTITLVNVQAERLFRYRRDELVGQLVEILVPEEVRPAHPGHRRAYIADPRSRPMGAGLQLAARRKDGTCFPAEISLSSVETDDGLLVSAAVRDVSDRLEAQAERERLQAQAERNRLESRLRQSEHLEGLGQLAGGVAHDFNNLLGAIQGYATFIKEEVDVAAAQGDQRWVAVAADVEQIQRAAERAAGLTHQLLVFARREVVQPEVLNLNDIVAKVEQLLRRTIGEHIELVSVLAPGLRPVFVDRGQIEQVLVNLAVNARDAMPAGGRLTIESSNLDADENYAHSRPDVRPGPYVRLRVSDTGTGMNDEVIARAFEPFFTTKPKGEGTGLGLATVHGIISQAGGQTQIYSEVGIGTTITTLLPATGAVSASAPSVDSTHRNEHETILVVEDEDAIREVTRRVLSGDGYRVLTATNGAEALSIAADHRGDIALLITDVVMPGMFGPEVAQRFLETCPAAAVLFMSGYAQGVLGPTQTLDPGVTLIEKPFSANALLAAVRKAMDT